MLLVHFVFSRDNRFCAYVNVVKLAADLNCLKVPDDMDDEHAILLSDILPTAWHGNELGRVGKGDNVAIWGCGPGT